MAKKTTKSQFLTVSEYADRFNLPANTVRNMLKIGKLQQVEIERQGKTLIGVKLGKEMLTKAENTELKEPSNSNNGTSIKLIKPNDLVVNEATKTKASAQAEEELVRVKAALEEAKLKIARLEGETSRIDEYVQSVRMLLDSKENQIESLKDQVSLLKTQVELSNKSKGKWFSFK
ncbi:MAG: hypothetical protein SFT81_06930 [Candidatus Caenarcaniphilales bacterium]|nr:hypothetical protein [Candidatus Caenarcaniphilales bacterium]